MSDETARIRATVHLIRSARPNPDDDGDFANYDEWVHDENLTFDDHGVWLTWDYGGPTWIPYSNIARIDYQDCICMSCAERVTV